LQIRGALIALFGGLAAAGEGTTPRRSPRSRRRLATAEKVRIEFAVDRETDVAVYIENTKGEVVRHLVAGVLGPKAPEPLKAGALAQSVEWTARTTTASRPPEVRSGVRVGLGLKASWGGTAFSDKSGPAHVGAVTGLAAGPDGRLYVMDNRSGWLYWPASAVHVFLRDGSYERTIKPFPSNLAPERLKGTGAFKNDRGFLNPVIHRTQGMTFYPFEDEPARQMTVTPDGRLLLAAVPSQARPTATRPTAARRRTWRPLTWRAACPARSTPGRRWARAGLPRRARRGRPAPGRRLRRQVRLPGQPRPQVLRQECTSSSATR